MIIVITDACFLIDLIDINLFEEFLGLGYQIHITSSVFAELEGDEYLKPVSKCIKQKKVFLYNLTATDQTALEKLMGKLSSRLSEPDCSCLYGRGFSFIVGTKGDKKRTKYRYPIYNL